MQWLVQEAGLRPTMAELHAAAGSDLAVFQWLAEHLGKATVLDPYDGRTALHKAVVSGNLAVVQWIVQQFPGLDVPDLMTYLDDPVLHTAAAVGHLDIVCWLVQSCWGPAAVAALRDSERRTVLHAAAARGDLELVRWLVGHCWEPAAVAALRDDQGRTVLHAAAASRDLELVRWLVGHCWKPAAVAALRDSQGRSVLHAAVEHGYGLALVRWLVEHCWDPAAVAALQDNEGRTVLHSAAAAGDLEPVRWLIQQCWDPAAAAALRDNKGRTVLHAAASSFSVKTVAWLVETVRADVNARDSQGRTLLHAAMEAGRCTKEMAQYLVTAGVQVSAQTSNGDTVLDLARGPRSLMAAPYLTQQMALEAPAQAVAAILRQEPYLHQLMMLTVLEAWMSERKAFAQYKAQEQARKRQAQDMLVQATCALKRCRRESE